MSQISADILSLSIANFLLSEKHADFLQGIL